MEPVREPAVAGQFYPGNPKALREAVDGYLANAKAELPSGRVVGMLAPHAGYMYSGPVAGWAYKPLQGKSFDTVVVLAPSHRVPLRGASIMARGAYRTPLGLVPIDEERAKKLMRGRGGAVQEIREAHGPEHSLEVQLPFLQVVLQQGWRLVPLVLGSQDLQTARAIAEGLEEALHGTNALVIASSDLSHYHAAEPAEKMDRRAIGHMEKVDPEGLWKLIRDGDVEACGIGPILVVLTMAQKAQVSQGTLLKYAHSGDVSGERTRVVGYAAMAWVAKQEAVKEKPAVGVDLGLTDGEKRALKEIAKTTIQCRLDGRPVPEFQGITETLREPRGAFVTLEKRHQLRGCIGFIHAIKPLYQTIQEMAEAAAFRDPRFSPLRKEEWPDVSVEISVLTPMRRIKDVSEIQVGTHGLYIVKEPYRGLLLPQVATDYGWDQKSFLEHTCTKAGLPTDAWKDPAAEIYVFSADIF